MKKYIIYGIISTILIWIIVAAVIALPSVPTNDKIRGCISTADENGMFVQQESKRTFLYELRQDKTMASTAVNLTKYADGTLSGLAIMGSHYLLYVGENISLVVSDEKYEVTNSYNITGVGEKEAYGLYVLNDQLYLVMKSTEPGIGVRYFLQVGEYNCAATYDKTIEVVETDYQLIDSSLLGFLPDPFPEGFLTALLLNMLYLIISFFMVGAAVALLMIFLYLYRETNSFVWQRFAMQQLIIYAIVCVTFFTTQKIYFLGIVIVWVAGSIALLNFTNREHDDLVTLAMAVESASKGRDTSVKIPQKTNRDYERIWLAARDVLEEKKRANYTRDKMFLAYSRFAPRNIKSLLGKESMLEVTPGEYQIMRGIVVNVSLNWDRDQSNIQLLEQMNKDFAVITKTQVDNDGVLLFGEPTLGSMHFLFEDSPKKAINFASNIIKLLANRNPVILMHETKLTFGIAGTNEQAFTFIDSDDLELLQGITKKIQEYKVGMVMTEQMAAYMDDSIKTRCIGYVNLSDDGRNMNLFEVLDVLPVAIGKKRLANREQFKKALSMYYHNDFYLARNMFTEILKQDGDDEIAKWYVFACEDLLKLAGEKEYDYSLFVER
ncbi:hypothetical protein [Pseudobutyrivibrio sp.]|uniref:hypothetical protein n=1 Tax=Pseudobutyrivibrio sp. TaxID=2014367 RepID=UPI001B4D4670|nr:hypothetical protein [Pseudobutyrivibrio sp.]MBP3261174.1 hypothetical protein [Pseudobutyrivibrio sp.]